MEKLTKRKLALACVLLLVLNLILSTLLFYLDNTGAEHLDGTYIEPQSSELLLSLFKGQVISFPIICLLLGAITTIFIERDKPYKKRYLKGFLLTLASVYGLFSAMGLIRVIMLL